MTNIKEKLLKIFFSEECIVCKEPGDSICRKCLVEIKRDNIINKNLDKIYWVKSCFSYKNKNLHLALMYLKYYHNKSIARYLSEISYILFLNFVNKISYQNIIIIPIPISKKRKLERGYNQSEILLKVILKNIKEKENINLENNLYTDLIIKSKHTIKFAHTHSHTDREKLIKNAFILNEKYKDIISEKKIILFDDITTTGATLYEARNLLLSYGVKKENIFGFVIAH